MADATRISWADATFNPWWGCVEVSPACDHCYARDFAKYASPGLWGPHAPRRFFADRHWDEPLRWHRRAEKAGKRHRVFCASMADVLEERHDAVGHEMDRARQRLWSTIADTPALDWLLLTKRPQNYRRFVPAEILARPNVWPGTTAECDAYHWRVQSLLQLSCAGPRWVSYEPVLGPLSAEPGIAWYIVGGESGPVHRPMNLAWLENLVHGCRTHGAAVFVKQDSARRPRTQGRIPEALWLREFPQEVATGA